MRRRRCGLGSKPCRTGPSFGRPPDRSWEIDADPGEAEAIALAIETGYDLLTDDRLAARSARNAGVEVVGTLGILQKAHACSLLDIDDSLADLAKTTFRHTPELFARVAHEAKRLRGQV